MEIEVEEKEGYHIVSPVGELDIYTVPLFRKVVLKLEGDRRHDLILDLSRLTFIDSSGLGSLIGCYFGVAGTVEFAREPGLVPRAGAAAGEGLARDLLDCSLFPKP